VEQADQYRRKAEEADKQAEQSRDPETQQIYRAFAERWRTLAKQVERFG
jgi:hypothetical protein